MSHLLSVTLISWTRLLFPKFLPMLTTNITFSTLSSDNFRESSIVPFFPQDFFVYLRCSVVLYTFRVLFVFPSMWQMAWNLLTLYISINCYWWDGHFPSTPPIFRLLYPLARCTSVFSKPWRGKWRCSIYSKALSSHYFSVLLPTEFLLFLSLTEKSFSFYGWKKHSSTGAYIHILEGSFTTSIFNITSVVISPFWTVT